MQRIRLTKGYKTEVDDDDVLYLLQWSWHAHISNGVPYAARCYKIKRRVYISYMHRQIAIERKGLIIPDGMLIDHEDNNSLNNQKYNIRVANLSINGHNSKLPKSNTSGHRGVRYNKKQKAWTARIYINRSHYWLGTYYNEDAAIEARKRAEILYNPKNL